MDNLSGGGISRNDGVNQPIPFDDSPDPVFSAGQDHDKAGVSRAPLSLGGADGGASSKIM